MHLTSTETLIVTEHMLNPQSVIYNLNPVLHFKGALSPARLEYALQLLLQRHTILNASYHTEGGVLVRKIRNTASFQLTQRACTPDALTQEVEKLNVPYDLAREPLYRFTLFALATDTFALHMSFHHAIMDATSFGVLLQDLVALYDGKELAPLERDYFDHATWQREQADMLAEQAAFFVDMFHDGIVHNAMPCHAIRPKVLPLTEKCVSRRMSSETFTALQQYARKAGVTVYTLVMAAASLTTSRYCNSEDIVLSTGLHGRTQEFMSVVGMFSKEMPVRTYPRHHMPFEEFLAELANTLAGVRAHQTCSMDAVLAQMHPTRDASRKLFADVSVNYLQAFPCATLDDGRVEVHLQTFVGQATPVDWAFEVARQKDGLELSLHYSPVLYEDGVAHDVLELFTIVLQRIGERRGEKNEQNTQGTLLELTRLPERQKAVLLHSFSGLRTEQPTHETVISLFKKCVAHSPEALALVAEGVRYTYAELDHISDKLACHLVRMGVKKGVAVGILVGRNSFMSIAPLAVLKAGAAYVPLDPAYPASRLEFMLQDTGASLVLVDEAYAELLANYNGNCLLTTSITDLQEPTQGLLPPLSTPDNVLVYLYTSGTTGTPKGVMWSHANFANFCAWYQEYFALTQGDHVAAYASFGFDASIKETLVPLTAGAAVHIIPDDIRLDFPALKAFYNTHGITVGFLTTQVGRQFAQLQGLETLRTLTMGGESLAPFEPISTFSLYNLYGPTECTCLASAFHYDQYYDRPPVGKPVHNTDFYVLDDLGRLQPVGVEGELYIAGRQVALGYKNRPDLTEKVFLANPFHDISGYATMYKTGDTARWRADGNLEILGRRDLQVKIRGFRVELGEIENRIRAFEDVKNVALLPADAPGGGKCAIAYVVASKTLSLQKLRVFIMEALPVYMVPASIMQVDSIPLTPNGKVDAKKLPAPVFSENSFTDALSANNEDGSLVAMSQSRLQGELSSIVERVLGHGNFSVTTNLLHAGLASLSAIMVITRVSERYALDLPIHAFLAEPTVLALENLLVDALLNNSIAPCAPHVSEAQQRLFPLSESQMGVYYECAKHPESTVYNIPFRLDLDVTQKDHEGLPPDAMRLQKALLTVIDAHPVLKTHFVQQDGKLWQCVGASDITVDVLHCTPDTLEKLSQDFVRPFILLDAPLCRCAIVSTETHMSLLFDAHHCIFDGMSADIFLRELHCAYEGGALSEKQGIPSLFDAAQRESLAEGSESWLRGSNYVKDLLYDYNGLCALASDTFAEKSFYELTDDSARDSLVGSSGTQTGERHECVQVVNKAAVQAFCKASGITEASLFLAASAYTLHRFLTLDANSKLYLVTINNGRNSARLAKAMGMFVRTLPLALGLPHGATRYEFLEYTQNALRQAMRHEDYPFTRIAQDYDFEPAIMYACELGLLEPCALAGQSPALHSLASTKPKFPLAINVEERQGEYMYVLHYDSAMYSAELMERLAQCMDTALHGILQHPKESLATLSLVNDEQRALLRAFGQRPLEGEPTTFTAVFEEAARTYAERTALIACDKTLTYEELNAQANRLAHALLARGVRVEDKVAFVLERTSLVLIAILGIVKAGCAFIPVDPTYPKKRIAHVLEDSSAPILLVDKDCGKTEERGAASFANALNIRELLQEYPHNDHTYANPLPAYGPEHLAYVIYTSGSTGKPKGVMIPHAGIANYVLAHERNISMDVLAREARVAVSITTVAFDMFLTEAFGALMHGLTLVFADEEATRNPVRLAELFAQTKPDMFSATPSRMLDFMENDALREAILACKIIMAGGEKYPPLLFTHLKRSQARLFNRYGPTEISVACNATEITDTRITVGAPMYNVREYVVDRDGNDLPVGVTGELLVGGRGVARGYVNLPEETAKRFITHNNERVYRTGDLAAWTPQGAITILGRNDGQIKLRGLRIELGEIEKTLNALPDIKRAVVIVRYVGQEEHLCAYCVADVPLNFTHIRQELAKSLTHYMVPTGYLQVASMPKTPNGKLDAKALPLPHMERTGVYEAPVGDIECALCTIFGEVLKRENVGATDNFFEQGGTSLGVTRLLGLAHKHNVHAHESAENRKLSYTDIFAFPTPRQLARLLQGEDLTQTENAPLSDVDATRDYDYSAINRLLANNTIDAFYNEASRPLGNALFTGATGFLGITLLYQFLKHEQGTAYCVLRKGKFTSVEKRLTMLLYFYFAERFDDLIGTRIIPIEGDVAESDWIDGDWLALAEKDGLHTVFNCAANVRHFAHDNSIERVNIDGAMRCIELCKKTGARLIHVSTVSVAGFSIDGQPEAQCILTEQNLYFGQQLENQYLRSKFMAERHIFEAVIDGLDAKIMRVGNLTGRASDGEFQINAKSNSFSGRLRALSLLEYAPFIMADQVVDLSPVDAVAEAILLLARTPRACCLFHPVNNHRFLLGDLIDNMIAMDIAVQWTETETFNKAFEMARDEMTNMEDMVSLVAYQNMSQGHTVSVITSTQHQTAQMLKRLGWQWPVLGSEYHTKCIEALKTLGYFDKA